MTFYEGKGRFSKLVLGLLHEEEGPAINLRKKGRPPKIFLISLKIILAVRLLIWPYFLPLFFQL